MNGIRFPRDEGAHRRAKNEWWYFNSHVTSTEGREFGCHFNFVKDRLVVMLADFAKGEMLCRKVVEGPSLVASELRLDLGFGSSWWRQTRQHPATYEAHLECDGVRASLSMESDKPPLLLNKVGRVKEGLLGESYYYAQTRLRVKGSLGIEGDSFALSGVGWIDRQWGDWDWTGLGPWRWFSAQLEGGRELIGFEVRHPLSEGVVVSALNASMPGGETLVLGPFGLVETAGWTSAKTGIHYGRAWRVESGPGLSLEFEARFPDQELQAGFWEGACSVGGTVGGEQVSGVGYFEQADPVFPVGRRLWSLCLPLGVVNHVVSKATRGLGPDVWAHVPVKWVRR